MATLLNFIGWNEKFSASLDAFSEDFVVYRKVQGSNDRTQDLLDWAKDVNLNLKHRIDPNFGLRHKYTAEQLNDHRRSANRVVYSLLSKLKEEEELMTHFVSTLPMNMDVYLPMWMGYCTPLDMFNCFINNNNENGMDVWCGIETNPETYTRNALIDLAFDKFNLSSHSIHGDVASLMVKDHHCQEFGIRD